MQHFFARFCRFPGRDDHARIRYRNADTCYDLFKHFVGNSVVKYIWVDIIGAPHSRHADRVRAYPFVCFQMLRVHQNACKIIAVIVQPKQHAQPDVVDSAVHRPVHRLRMVGIVALWPGRVQLFILLLIVGFLE